MTSAALTFADAQTRFSSRVADYVRYRPSYPSALIDLLKSECGLLPTHQIADIGSSTGFLSKLFLRNGNYVYTVEPNAEMRAAGDEFLAAYPNCTSLSGSAEATGLADNSIDFVTAGQAFHWFDAASARREFRRILKPRGWVVIVWNDRRIAETQFGRDYENLLVIYGTDYKTVRDAYPEAQDMLAFFGSSPNVVAGLQTGSLPNFQRRELPNYQEMDLDALTGRLRSSSYAPQAGHRNHEPMLAALRKLFDSNQQNGLVRMNYTTQIYFGQLDRSAQ